MIEQLAAALFWLVILAPIVLFARQIQQVQRGAQGKMKATGMFFVWALVPTLTYAMALFALVGIEQLIETPLVGEGIARTAVFVIGIGLAEVSVLTAIFAIATRFLRVARNPASAT
ncbi:MAG: hypothetical protein ACKVQU_01610 [Burkholderiales bacterium]